MLTNHIPPRRDGPETLITINNMNQYIAFYQTGNDEGTKTIARFILADSDERAQQQARDGALPGETLEGCDSTTEIAYNLYY